MEIELQMEQIFLFFYVPLSSCARGWHICCINSQGIPEAGMFVEQQIAHQSFI